MQLRFFPRNVAAMLCGTVLDVQDKIQTRRNGQRDALASEFFHSTLQDWVKKDCTNLEIQNIS